MMMPANYAKDRVQKLAKDAKESGLNTVEISRIIFLISYILTKKELKRFFELNVA